MLLSSDDPLVYLEKLRTALETRISTALTRGKSKERKRQLGFGIQFFMDGLLATFVRFFRESGTYSLEDIQACIHVWFEAKAQEE